MKESTRATPSVCKGYTPSNRGYMLSRAEDREFSGLQTLKTCERANEPSQLRREMTKKKVDDAIYGKILKSGKQIVTSSADGIFRTNH